MEHGTFDYTFSFSNFEHIRIALPLSNVLQTRPPVCLLKLTFRMTLQLFWTLVVWSVRVYGK